MSDRRFEELRAALLQAGVSARQVRRAMLEIETHHRQLIDEEREWGASERDAALEADRRLGSNEILVQRYAARPELHAWSQRWPALWFTLVPSIAYVLLCGASFLLILLSAEAMAPYLHHVHVAPRVTHGVDLAASILMLWIFPSLIAAAFAVAAYRRRVPLRWPLIGIFLTSALASLGNVAVRFTGGPNPGEIGAGVGFSPESLPGQFMRVVVLVLFALIPMGLAMRRACRGYNVG